MAENETLASRLRVAMANAGLSAKDVSQRSGLSNTALSFILNGKSTDIKFGSAIAISKAVRCDPFWLMTGELHQQSLATFTDSDEPADGMVAIKQYHICVACGSDSPEPTYESLNESRPSWYHDSFFKRLGIDPNMCRKLQVTGDSMAPLINDGDWVLIYCADDQPIIDGEIYGFYQTDRGLRVKRVYKPMKGGLIIHSDNPKYQDEIYSDDENINFKLIGRVLERSGSLV